MAVLLDSNTRLIVQGLTGREGTFHAKAAAALSSERGPNVAAINTARIEATPARGASSACHMTRSVA